MCRRNVLIGVFLMILLLGSTVAQAERDVFSVNLYAYNGVPAGQEENVPQPARASQRDRGRQGAGAGVARDGRAPGIIADPVFGTQHQHHCEEKTDKKEEEKETGG